MNRFYITHINVNQNDDYSQMQILGGGNPTPLLSNPSISLSIDVLPEAGQKMQESVDALNYLRGVLEQGTTVCISNADYLDVLEGFKEEFADFLTERHPDKISKTLAFCQGFFIKVIISCFICRFIVIKLFPTIPFVRIPDWIRMKCNPMIFYYYS